MRRAMCHCGALQLACEGEPTRVSLCHCLDCQRRTGSAFSIVAFFPRERVRVESGEVRAFERGSAGGFNIRFQFCVRCGSNVFWYPARMPHLVGVAVGAFADPAFSMPEQSVWTKDKHGWVTLPAGVRVYEVGTPDRVEEE